MSLAEEVKEKLKELWIDSEVIKDKGILLLQISENEYIEIIKNEESQGTVYRLTWAMPKNAALNCIKICNEIKEVAFDGDPHTVLPASSTHENRENDLWHVVIADKKSSITADWILDEIKEFIKKRCIENENRPEGVKSPAKYENLKTEYKRSTEVKDWVLKNAKGICECCNKEGPFIDDNGKRYLEVHHVTQLASDGPDTVENTVAVCPNCHRKLHHGCDEEKSEATATLLKNVRRLKTGSTAS